MRTDTMVTAALAAARRGWPVFPLRPDDKRPAFPDHGADRCTGRDPRCRAGHVGWEARATTDPDRIVRAWHIAPYGVGIACGPAGLVVIDLDTPKPADTVRPGCRDIRDTRDSAGQAVAAGTTGAATTRDGREVFAALCTAHSQPYPQTYTVTTGRGGRHLYFAHPTVGPRLRNTTGGTRGSLGESIDTRAHGGYVVAAGSTVTGRRYRLVADRAPVPLPSWLAGLLTPAPLPPQRPVRLDLPRDRRGAYLSAAIGRQIAHIAAAPDGARNRALYLSAVALGQLVAGGALAVDEVTAVLKHAGTATGLGVGEVDRAIRSGLRAGARRPRKVA